MKIVYAFVIAAAGVGMPGLAGAAPGYARLDDTSLKDRPLALSIWYPSDDAASAKIGGNAVFVGTPAAVDTPVPTKVLPLIIVSHGGLRSAADSGAWLSAALAGAGAIVVEVNAPRPQNGSEATSEIWKRPQDISRALDRLMGSPVWKGHIDRSRISAVGFALGGTAALIVAGKKIDTNSYARSCAAGNPSGPDCAWYSAQGIDLEAADQGPLKQPLRDVRFTSVVALAPEYLAAFDKDAATADFPALVMSLGGDGASPTDVGQDTLVSLPDAADSDAFAACTEAGAKILLEDGGDETLCGRSQASRLTVHRAIASGITHFLAEN